MKTLAPSLFKHLAQEHADLLALLRRVQRSAAVQAGELYARAERELLAHGKGEAEVVYGGLSGGAQAHAEHEDLGRLLRRLALLDPAKPEWRFGFDELVASVEAHVAHEEDGLFEDARERVSAAQAANMEARFRLAKARELDRLNDLRASFLG